MSAERSPLPENREIKDQNKEKELREEERSVEDEKRLRDLREARDQIRELTKKASSLIARNKISGSLFNAHFPQSRDGKSILFC